MGASRRDFIKLFGVGVASIFMARCKSEHSSSTVGPVTCYEATAPPLPTASPTPPSARGRLRICWTSFEKLAAKSIELPGEDQDAVTIRQQLIDDHRNALDELVANGELTSSIADLIQEAYEAAVYHVWRSNMPATCYISAGPLYGPESAAALVQQSELLDELADQGTIDPGTLAKARAALEHDLAYYSLSEADLEALSAQLAERGIYTPFDELDLEVTPDGKAAAQFILDLLTGNKP